MQLIESVRCTLKDYSIEKICQISLVKCNINTIEYQCRGMQVHSNDIQSLLQYIELGMWKQYTYSLPTLCTQHQLLIINIISSLKSVCSQ